nr:hypothetical protein CFP56_21320 [Quercus suber]
MHAEKLDGSIIPAQAILAAPYRSIHTPQRNVQTHAMRRTFPSLYDDGEHRDQATLAVSQQGHRRPQIRPRENVSIWQVAARVNGPFMVGVIMLGGLRPLREPVIRARAGVTPAEQLEIVEGSEHTNSIYYAGFHTAIEALFTLNKNNLQQNGGFIAIYAVTGGAVEKLTCCRVLDLLAQVNG